ncbi:unnamed protein product [Citrullus colocynthis]|uniref:Uncharacterized protein n=1 Tax=Citrullus colocynthis TaxID=252529 RepID=A0ABP0YFD9_9ROSI
MSQHNHSRPNRRKMLKKAIGVTADSPPPWLIATYRHSTTVTSAVNSLHLGSPKEHYLDSRSPECRRLRK